MKLTVRYHTTLINQVGIRQECLDLPDTANLGDLEAVLSERHPGISPLLSIAVVALNGTFARRDTSLKENDEVGFFPPLSGG